MINVLVLNLPLILLFALVGAMFLGFPIAFTLGGLSLVFAGLGVLIGSFEPSLLLSLPSRIYGVLSNEVLVAVPLFLFMGRVLEKAGLAEDLLRALGGLMGRRPGGLGLATVLVGALLAGTTGVVAADVVTLGLIALPAMLKAGYRDDLACGIVCASATLAQIIPPATVLILIADGLSTANQRAQIEIGNFAPSGLSVGDVYAGAIIPGALLVTLYLAYVGIVAWRNPAAAPPADGQAKNLGWIALLRALVPTLSLIAIVLGSLLFGVATPTESASLGALGALVIAGAKGRLNTGLVREVMGATASGSTMIFFILIGASTFAIVFRGLGGDAMVETGLTSLPGGLLGAMFLTMVIIFVLGCFLDTFEIIFIVVPLFAPALIKLGADPLWLGVMIGLNLQTSFLIPPHGYTLAYLRAVAPASVPTIAIWRGVLPFVAIQLLALVAVGSLPWLATALPDYLYETSKPPPAKSPFNALPKPGSTTLPPLDLIRP